MITKVEQILAQASQQAARPRLVLVGAENEASLASVVAAHTRGIAEGTLVGDEAGITAAAGRLGVDVSPLELVARSDPTECVAAAMGVVQAGQADVIVKGQVSTHMLLKSVLNKKYGLRTNRALSHTSVFNVPGEDRVLLITDAGVNVQPDLHRKRDILMNAVDVAHALGIETPRVAVMSFVEEVTDRRISSLADAEKLVGMYRQGRIPGCIVEGPHSLDTALSVEAAAIKGVKGEVAGRADIIVMNDIGMGNILYKALLLWVKPTIANVVLGAKAPLVVPSRADSAETKLNSIALAIMILRHRQGLVR